MPNVAGSATQNSPPLVLRYGVVKVSPTDEEHCFSEDSEAVALERFLAGQSLLPPTRGRGRAVLRSISTDVRRGRLNTDPPAPVATGQTVRLVPHGETAGFHGTVSPRLEEQRVNRCP